MTEKANSKESPEVSFSKCELENWQGVSQEKVGKEIWKINDAENYMWHYDFNISMQFLHLMLYFPQHETRK